MKFLLPSACCSALLLALLPAALPSHAAPLIQRCASPDGEVIYTDVPCAALGATPLPIRAELLTRIESENARARRTGGDTQAVQQRIAAAAPARRSPAAGCARSTTQLAMDIEGALSAGDVNAFAGSYHWVGIGNGQAGHILDRLDRLAGGAPVRAQFYDATIGAGYASLATGASGDSAAGILQLRYEDSGLVQGVDMDVHRYRGCYFVRF